MFRIRSLLAASFVAAVSLICTTSAAAQITLTAAPGQSPRASFLDFYSAVGYNQFTGLANGTTTVQFAPVGSAVIDGASVQGNQVWDVDGDGRFGIRFSRPVAGFGAEFGQSGGSLVLTFLSGGATIGTLSTVFTGGGPMRLVSLSGATFDAVTVSGQALSQLRMDNALVGAKGSFAAVAAVPEPATLGLLGLGLVGTGLVARRRRSASSRS